MIKARPVFPVASNDRPPPRGDETPRRVYKFHDCWVVDEYSVRDVLDFLFFPFDYTKGGAVKYFTRDDRIFENDGSEEDGVFLFVTGWHPSVCQGVSSACVRKG